MASLSAQKGQIVSWSLHWQGTGATIRARDCSPGWVVDKNGKAWMESFDSFRSWLAFCSWSSLRKDPHSSSLGRRQVRDKDTCCDRHHSTFLSKAKEQMATITCRYFCRSAVWLSWAEQGNDKSKGREDVLCWPVFEKHTSFSNAVLGKAVLMPRYNYFFAFWKQFFFKLINIFTSQTGLV